MANEKKVDRRILRTRKGLFAALQALLLQRPYTEITVSDICEQADVGRATFYLHYKDKDDLLASNLEGMFEEIVLRIRPLLREAIMSGNPLPATIVFTEAQANAPLYRMILSGQGGTVLWQRLHQVIIDMYAEIIKTLVVGGDSPIDIPILATFCATGMLSLVKWWLENDTPHSAEYMAAVWRQLIRPSLQGVVLLDDDWFAKGT